MGFRFFRINCSFLSMHITCGYYADQRFLPAKCEHHVQHAAIGCFPERMITGLCLTVPRIRNNNQRITKEHGFRFRLRDVMLLGALSSVTFVPVEAFHSIQFDHICILSQYTLYGQNSCRILHHLTALEPQGRYITRPALAMDALQKLDDGNLALEAPPEPRSRLGPYSTIAVWGA